VERLFAQRNADLADRPQESMKDVRKNIEAAYRKITGRIDAAVIMNNDGTCDEFIAQLNEKITYENNRHHHAKKDLAATDHCVVEPIDTQTFTGKAVTPLPAAHYREDDKPTTELVFAKDFEVTYKNNTDVGTADLVIHGKGEYKGQKTVTFNIARV
jgi:hypothetical protein